ncbi:hypothetical protein OHW83_07965 [Acinetobacter baumannii]|uniref:hypothetical protein n=1 Tax=Acinetobacter baumannii TaxID=470 RepID=UPI00233F96CB|nr:hypothetical protein [Acinetobacter baumannii]MDC5297796.1 hypothetical protein [Acinetobacter baumannii]MEC6739834.1 hypothetical protein [Acinetobacter baumannii]
MEIPLDILIDSPSGTNSINMKDGLLTFQGMVDITLTIAQTVAHEKVPTQKTYKDDVRADMLDNFLGSYGLNFKLIADNEADKTLKQLGEKVVIELIKYFLAEALNENIPVLSSKAAEVVEKLDKVGLELIAEIKGRMMRNAHQMLVNYGYDTKLRHRENSEIKREIQTFNETTFETLSAKVNPTPREIEAVITRFNILTGNGRLQLKGAVDTHAFGFNAYKGVASLTKSLISKNLSDNTIIVDPEKLIFLKLLVKAQERTDGKVIKYMVQKII